MKNYSQCDEDIYLNKKYFKNMHNGVYLELGALDGILYSNTKFFEDNFNWSGILIEPHPIQFKQLKKNRPNNYLFNDLISCEKEELKFKYFDNVGSAVSGIETTLPKNHFDAYFNNEKFKDLCQSDIMIKPKTLTEIIKNTNIKKIDFLSLDVEGHEYEVLKSFDYSILIDLILIESLDDNNIKNNLCDEILKNNGYKFIEKYKHNNIYINKLSKLVNDI